MFTDIVTERLVLRRLAAADTGTMFAYRADPEVARYQGWEPATVDEVGAFIAGQSQQEPDVPDSWFQLAITLRDGGEMIGDLGLHTLDAESRTVEVGITLAPGHQGRGYATEALSAALRHLFVDLKKHRVYGSVDPRNGASIALLERVGMRREAHLVESLRFKGEWVDDVIYAMLDREWTNRDRDDTDA